MDSYETMYDSVIEYETITETFLNQNTYSQNIRNVVFSFIL